MICRTESVQLDTSEGTLKKRHTLFMNSERCRLLNGEIRRKWRTLELVFCSFGKSLKGYLLDVFLDAFLDAFLRHPFKGCFGKSW